MQEPNDKHLHDWVRKTLPTYQPAPQPQDWIRMQKKLRQRYWWRMGFLCLGCVLIGIMGLWWFYRDAAPYKPVQEKAASTESRPQLEHSFSSQNQVIPATRADSSTIAMEGKANSRLESRKHITVTAITQTIHVLKQNVSFLLQKKAESSLPQVSIPLFSLEENHIRYQMQTGDFGADSTSYQVFSRNVSKWPDAVVVCDLTTSMYPYSVQIFSWLQKNSQKPNIKAVLFFTDCDSTGQETRLMETSGQMFVSTSLQAENVLPVMVQAARNTVRNGNSEENDIEALLYAQQQFPEAKHLILIADNSSAVKDMAFLENIKKPVHVILCGSAADSTQAFQPEYKDIALQTKGSLHTMEDDLNPGEEKKQPWLQVGERFYRYDVKKKQYKLTRFRYRPKHIMGLFWL
ncbi:hypothetical protein GXP67_03880 [Rhodocytophaga rosea]|uniref:VWA domain-containing protein n=1 Tax=Rhodocytophaga rosea TaxID=2704465 RepID=A0A6C0GD22_9BACT|nr:hypothetical protein [Rhodocytophaga rosea]QHT65865.1 hypothetical protein GXP67_03880 [Rhodocytophaga rosea]